VRRCFGILLCAVLAIGQVQQNAAATARRALDLLLGAKYVELNAMLTDIAKERLNTAFLRDKVGGEVKGFGKQGAIGRPVSALDGKSTLVSFPVHFAETTVNIQFTLNEKQQIAGLYLRPPNTPLPPLRQQPAYSTKTAFAEREVTVGANPWKLGGTLVMPSGKGPFPALVLVHGPGPNDRDETIFSTRIFKDLAEGLATRGVAVLRYDKRTKTYGDRMGSVEFTVEQETVADAVSALMLLRSEPGVDPKRVFLLGHSLGGYLAPRIAARDKKLGGIVLLAANARPIEDMALEQNTYAASLNGPPTAEGQKRLASLRAEVAKVKALAPGKVNPPIVMGLPAAYLLDLKGYDAVAAAKALSLPLLVLQGERDFQTTMTDFNLWKRMGATAKSYPALNHLFIAGQGKSSPAEYRAPGNVAPEVISDIATWILR
jgi:dienelactone hydrolase